MKIKDLVASVTENPSHNLFKPSDLAVFEAFLMSLDMVPEMISLAEDYVNALEGAKSDIDAYDFLIRYFNALLKVSNRQSGRKAKELYSFKEVFRDWHVSVTAPERGNCPVVKIELVSGGRRSPQPEQAMIDNLLHTVVDGFEKAKQIRDAYNPMLVKNFKSVLDFCSFKDVKEVRDLFTKFKKDHKRLIEAAELIKKQYGELDIDL